MSKAINMSKAIKFKDHSGAIATTIGIMIIVVAIIVIYFLLQKKKNQATVKGVGSGGTVPGSVGGSGSISDQLINELANGTISTGTTTDAGAAGSTTGTNGNSDYFTKVVQSSYTTPDGTVWTDLTQYGLDNLKAGNYIAKGQTN